MPLIYFKTRDAVPAELADVAAEVSEDGEYKGQFAVNVVSRKKLDEFRTNNTDLAQKLELSNKRFKSLAETVGISDVENLDLEAVSKDFSTLKETARRVADGALKATDDIEKELLKRTEAMRNKFDETLQAKQVEVNTMKTERDTAISNYKRTFIDKAVAAVIADPELGLHPTALADVMQKAYTVFVVEEDGGITPKEAGGQTMWGEDGSSKMTMKEWINLRLRKESPHYFKKSTGGGATGGNEKQYGGLTEAEFNQLSPQRRLQIANEQTFARMARQGAR